MGCSIEGNAAPCSLDQRPGIFFGCDLVHCNTAWPHSPQHSIDPLHLAAPCQNIGSRSGRKTTCTMGIGKQLSPLVHDGDAPCGAVSISSDQIPQIGCFSAARASDHQNGGSQIFYAIRYSPKIPCNTQAYRCWVANTGHSSVLYNSLSAQPYPMSPCPGYIAAGSRCCRPWRVV